MATYTRLLLTGSTNGTPIPVAAIATPGTLIHTAVVGVLGSDEVYLWASNVTAAAVSLTVEWGGVADPGSHIVKQISIPANSRPTEITLGQPLQNGLIVRAFAGTAGALNITGYVNRIQ